MYNATGRELTFSSTPNGWPASSTGAAVRTGGSANDVFFSSGTEVLRGLSGDDTYHMFGATASVEEAAGAGIDTIRVHFWGAAVLPENVENLLLESVGATMGTGNGLDNIIRAGETGATLFGAGGNDILIGGSGGDVFRVVSGSGSEAIVNFQHGWDAIKLEGYAVASFAQLMTISTQVGNDVRFDFGNGEILVLRDVDCSNLEAADFNFLDNVRAPVDGETYMVGPAKVLDANGWSVLNNAWGSGHLKQGTDYVLESVSNRSDMTAGTEFSWKYPLTTELHANVLAYPFVGWGYSPYGGGTNPTAQRGILPALVGDVVMCDLVYDLEIGGNTSGFNVAFDIWFTSRPYGTEADLTNEVMIWLHDGSAPAFGPVIGQFVSDGVTYDIHHTGTYTALVADRDVLSGTIRFQDMIDHLIEIGILSDDEYLASIMLGSEVFSGSGSLKVNNFDFTVAQTDDAGNIKVAEITGAKTTVTEVAGSSKSGNDTYVLGSDQRAIADAGGIDTIVSSISRDLNNYADIENLTLIGQTNVSATGNAKNNVLTGNDGDNILDGGPGADTLIGGLGNDTYVLLGATNDTLVELAGGGIDTITSTITRDLRNYSHIENLTLTFSAHVDGFGNAADNVITGNAGRNSLFGFAGNDTLIGGLGNDTLDGGEGADILIGGLGNDTYVLGDGFDTVIDEGGWDAITSTISRDLNDYADIENLTLVGTANINATGNAWSNVLTGNDGDNILDGGPGADTLMGGLGNDTYVLLSATNDTIYDIGGNDTITSTITRDLRLYSGIENLTLTFSAHVDGFGNEFGNVLTGNAGRNVLWGFDGDDILRGMAGDDTLYGGNGSDILDGGAGNDILIGGLGNDTYVLADGYDAVSDEGGWDTITSTISRSLMDYATIENLTLLGTGNINATGNAWSNTLTGNDGDNILDGGAGADTLIGGLGNDTYVLGAATNDTLVELAGGGNDTITSTISRSLADFSGIENITLTFSAHVNATGDSQANVLTGNNGNNVLEGLAGNDILDGGRGHDTLIGGAGSDVLIGGAGLDTFVFRAASDSTAGNADRIVDFFKGEDRIDLSAIDANIRSEQHDRFTLLEAEGAGFGGTAGELRWFHDTKGGSASTVVEFDFDGDAVADFHLTLDGTHYLTPNDFII